MPVSMTGTDPKVPLGFLVERWFSPVPPAIIFGSRRKLKAQTTLLQPPLDL